jgi:hypothetical protein
MKLNDIQKRIPIWYEAGLSITLRGKIGRGKSTVLESAPALIAASRGHDPKDYGFVVIQGPLLNPPDAVGYGVPQERETAIRKHLMMLFTEPFWFLTDDGRHIEEFKGGIVLIEEADKMDVDVKKIMGEMALSRRLGPHRLPKGWLVWFAGNRASDRSGSTKEFPHLINRTMEVEVDDDLQSVLDYYTKKNVLPVFTAFAADHSSSVFEDQPAIPAPWCTPRSLHQLADYTTHLMKANGGELPLDDIYREEAMGKIGEGAATALFATLDLLKVMPKFEDIVANPKGAPVPMRPTHRCWCASRWRRGWTRPTSLR